jgi:hypothetical protein
MLLKVEMLLQKQLLHRKLEPQQKLRHNLQKKRKLQKSVESVSIALLLLKLQMMALQRSTIKSTVAAIMPMVAVDM